MVARDWADVDRIYREGIATGNATFETHPPSWEAFDAGKLVTGRQVATDDTGTVLGWVAASLVSTRDTYRGVVEHSVYVAAAAVGKGIGRLLLGAFIEAAEADDIWTIQSSVFPENAASLALHERAGFRVVGRRERIAFMTYGPWADQWLDTIFLERRSTH